MSRTIVVIGALDTKGAEFAFVKAAIQDRGHKAFVVNTGIMGEPPFEPEVAASRVADAGGTPLNELRRNADRGEAISTMTRGAAVISKELQEQGIVDGVLGMGGSAGTVIATAAMRVLPVGIPKVMVSTIASADTSPYVGTRDIVMIHSVVDVAGINRISAQIYANAVGAVVGMVETALPEIAVKPLIAASMFGNTTELVDQCRTVLEAKGYEVLVFHATGTGGRTMENLIADGYFSAVLDVTTTELADEVVGGVLSAGPDRLNSAAALNLPQVIVPGCVDMVNFWAKNTVPEKYSHRLFYEWNPNVTLMRTTPKENEEIGRILAEKANQSEGAVSIFLPLKGVSQLDSPGGEFWWPEANEALFEAIKTHAGQEIEVTELDANINDQAFADAVTSKLLTFLQKQ